MPNHPGEPEEEHDAPDVEEAPHVDALHPAKLDGSSLFLLLGRGGLRVLGHPLGGRLERDGLVLGHVRLAVEQALQGGALRNLAACINLMFKASK